MGKPRHKSAGGTHSASTSHRPATTPGSFASRPWVPAVSAVFLIAVVCTVFQLIVHRGGAYFRGGYDWTEQVTFYKDFLRQAFSEGQFPLWCPYAFGGRPFAADPTTQCFYPVTLLWLLGSKSTAYVIDALLHYILGGCFATLFLRELKIRVSFSILGGLLYTLSGFNAFHTTSGHLAFHAATAWVPLVFWCIERAVAGRPVFWLWGGGVLGLQFLAGALPVSWMTFLFGGVYALARSAYPWSARRLVRAISGCAVMMILGTGISAVQLFPTAEFAANGVRNPNSYEYSLYNQLPPRNLLNFLYPTGQIDGPGIPAGRRLVPEGEYVGYIGILPLGLAVCGVALFRRRPPVAALSALAFLALVLMLGDATPLFRLLWSIVPGVAWLKSHCREVLILLFALIALAMLALEEMAQSARRIRAPKGPPARDWLTREAVWMAAALLFAFFAVAFFTFRGNPTAPVWQTGFIVLSIAALWLAPGAGAPAVAGALMALVLVDLTANATLLPGRPTAQKLELTRGEDPKGLSEDLVIDLVRKNGTLFRGHFEKMTYRRERYMTDRFYGLAGYSAMVPRGWHRLVHDLADTPIKTDLTNEVSQYTFTKRPEMFPWRVLNVKYTTSKKDDGSLALVMNPNPEPRAWLAGEAMVTSEDEAIRLLKSHTFDFLRTAILDADPPAGVALADPSTVNSHENVTPSNLSPDGRVSATDAGRCEIRDMALGSVTLQIEASRPAVLVLSEGWFPGWTVTVDGAAERLYRADVALRGVAVPPGRHEVVFRYRPRSVTWGAATTLLSMGAMAGGIVLMHRRRRTTSGGSRG